MRRTTRFTTCSSDPASRCLGRSRCGAAALELALVLPLLLTMVCACVDLGRVVHVYLAMANAGRAGADYGSTHRFSEYTRSSWQTQVLAAASDELRGIPEYDSGKAQVTLSTYNDSNGAVRLAIDTSYQFQCLVSWPGLPYDVTLRHHAEFRQYR